MKNINLIWASLRKRKWRVAGIILISAALSFFALTVTILILSINNGIDNLERRLGADMMVVPLGYEGGAQSILIKGEPGFFYFDRSLLDEIKDIEGVEKISPQFYLASSGQSCCDMPVQFIGIDEDSDFSVLPWVKEALSEDGKRESISKSVDKTEYLKDYHIIVGSDVKVPEDGLLKFYDEYYRVSAILEKTGTGLDQAVFANQATIEYLFEAIKKKGFNFIKDTDPKNNISNIMIKIQDGYTIEDVKHRIRMNIDGVQIVETKSMTGSISNSMKGFIASLKVLIIIMFAMTILVIYLTFKLRIKERERTYAVMRMCGASPGQIRNLITGEALILNITGTVVGIVLSLVLAKPFCTLLEKNAQLPYMLPKTSEIIAVSLIVLFVTVLAGFVSVFISAVRAGKQEIYILGKN